MKKLHSKFGTMLFAALVLCLCSFTANAWDGFKFFGFRNGETSKNSPFCAVSILRDSDGNWVAYTPKPEKGTLNEIAVTKMEVSGHQLVITGTSSQGIGTIYINDSPYNGYLFRLEESAVLQQYFSPHTDMKANHVKYALDDFPREFMRLANVIREYEGGVYEKK